ncbi:GNAT family N-acetyltransferase [Massilia sp. ZL223]|nr:GNAT family N-acetyltransferase [Massilia sp. ZL223]MBQ5962688.1 GNAT family N-acetyltransferase [Massilia sp. ZL223]
MSIRTRDASHDDLPHIAKLFDLYRQFYEQAPDAELARSFVEQRFLNRESRQLVAENAAGEIVGFSQLYPSFCSVEAAPIYVLYDLFVAPDARQGGVGRALLLAAEALARMEGKARMDLTTAKTNLVAQSLYESLGWTRDEVFHTYSRHLAP